MRRYLLKENGAKTTTEEDDMRAWVEGYAKKQGRVLNPDKKIHGTVIRGLIRNKKKSGEKYCPCRLRPGDEEKDKAIFCPCIYHKDEIARVGYCHCQLYYRKDAAEKAVTGRETE